jgi:hypothetical protein
MSTGQPGDRETAASRAPIDADYPYQPNTKAARSLELKVRSSYSPGLWRWIYRCFITALAAFILVGVVFGFLAYRVASQSWLVADLKRHGCSVRYGNEPVVEDALPAIFRRWFGDNWWSDVSEVSNWTFGFRTDSDSADDLNTICNKCAALPKLKSFTTNNRYFLFRQIKTWPQLNRLEKVSATTKELSSEDLAVIAQMRGLKEIYLRNTEFNANVYQHLSLLPKLETLNVSSVTFSSAPSNPARANGFKRLKRLEIFDSPSLIDEAVIALGPVLALEELVSNKTPLRDPALEHLCAGGKLRLVIMNESKITDAGLRLLRNNPQPLALHIAGAPVTDEGLGALAGKKFESLVLDNTAITDDGLLKLGSLHGLWYLSLDRTKVSGVGLRASIADDRFPLIHLQGAAITHAGLEVLAQLNVEDLCLDETQIDDNDLMLFADNDDLASLRVRHTRITADGVRALYEKRKQRLARARRPENLLIISEFSGIAENYLPESETERINDAFQLP